MLEGEAGYLAGAFWCRLATHYLWKPRSSDQQMVPSAGHLSVYTHFIVGLETSAHSAAQAGPASASRLCIILPKFLILGMFCLVF